MIHKMNNDELMSSSPYSDKNADVTLSRRIARFLSNYAWYCPSAASRAALDNAWAYFEHFTLPRYYVVDDVASGVGGGILVSDVDDEEEVDEIDGDSEEEEYEDISKSDRTTKVSNRSSKDTSNRNVDYFIKAEPGDVDIPTKLYPIYQTPESELADMGVGIGIYFYTLRVLSIILFLAGIISIPNLIYFYSNDYNPTPIFGNNTNYRISEFLLSTSAVCTDHIWVPCPNCTIEQFSHFPSSYERYAAETISNDDSSRRTFIKINDCHITKYAGISSYITMLFVCVSIFVVSKIIHSKQRLLDEQSQTSSDYSIEVKNPPEDAHNVEEWKRYFLQFGHVTSISIVRNNEILTRQLVTRRSLIKNLQIIQPPPSNDSNHASDIDLDDLATMYEKALPVSWYWKLYGYYDGPTIKQKIAEIDTMIKTDLQYRQYDVSEVFVIFETEHAQQVCLKELQQPIINVLTNNVGALSKPKDYAFRGKYVLDVIEAPEPSSVRWQDLDETWLVRSFN